MDDKVEILEAEYGLTGFAVYIKLLQEIYQIEDGKLDMSIVFRWKTLGKKFGISPENVEGIVNLCLEIGLFCKKCFSEEQKLTSNGIQKRLGKVSDMRQKDRRRKNEDEPEFSDGKPPENDTKGKGKGTNVPKKEKDKKKSKKENAPLVFPDFATEQFKETWGILLTQKKWRGKDNSALQLSLDKLARYNEVFAVYLMNEAIEHDWAGVVFSKKGSMPSTDELWREWQRTPPAQQQARAPVDDTELFGKPATPEQQQQRREAYAKRHAEPTF